MGMVVCKMSSKRVKGIRIIKIYRDTNADLVGYLDEASTSPSHCHAIDPFLKTSRREGILYHCVQRRKQLDACGIDHKGTIAAGCFASLQWAGSNTFPTQPTKLEDTHLISLVLSPFTIFSTHLGRHWKKAKDFMAHVLSCCAEYDNPPYHMCPAEPAGF
jgi:hypothetical protein